MKNSEHKLKFVRGISLIALVITIIVIILLAGAIITALVETGVIKNAKLAQEKNDIQTYIESIKLDISNVYLKKHNIQNNDIIEILTKYGTIEYEDENYKIKHLITKEGYVIPINRIHTNYEDVQKFTIIESLNNAISSLKQEFNNEVLLSDITKENMQKYVEYDINAIISKEDGSEKIILINAFPITNIYTINSKLEINESNENLNEILDTSYNYNTNNTNYEYDVLASGTYKIELWGASGGDVAGYAGGNGAYTSGNIDLTAGEKLYIYVGQKGSDSNSAKSQSITFNGGGSWNSNITTDRQGGGATDIRLINGSWNNSTSLISRIMVAAGGGGAGYYNGSEHGSGGAGGTLIGISPKNTYSGVAQGGTQTAGGKMGKATNYQTDASDGSFGIGGKGYYASGGGGGYYGGGGQDRCHGGGAGGSSYISGYEGCIAVNEKGSPKVSTYSKIEDSIHFSNKSFYNTIMYAGNENMPTFDGQSTMVGNDGNGYCKITFVE